jgi:hypothetical protein
MAITYLICKPNMFWTLRSILVLVSIVISILEEKYQPINGLATVMSAVVKMSYLGAVQ